MFERLRYRLFLAPLLIFALGSHVHVWNDLTSSEQILKAGSFAVAITGAGERSDSARNKAQKSDPALAGVSFRLRADSQSHDTVRSLEKFWQPIFEPPFQSRAPPLV